MSSSPKVGSLGIQEKLMLKPKSKGRKRRLPQLKAVGQEAPLLAYKKVSLLFHAGFHLGK